MRRYTFGPDTSQALNQLAREQMKAEILKDILRDAVVCSIEGWPHIDYLEDLEGLIDERITSARGMRECTA